MWHNPQSRTNGILFIAFITLFGLAFIRVHIRVQTTLMGYQLAQAKAQEAELLTEHSELQMTLTQLVTKKNLLKYAQLKAQSINLASRN